MKRQILSEFVRYAICVLRITLFWPSLLLGWLFLCVIFIKSLSMGLEGFYLHKLEIDAKAFQTVSAGYVMTEHCAVLSPEMSVDNCTNVSKPLSDVANESAHELKAMYFALLLLSMAIDGLATLIYSRYIQVKYYAPGIYSDSGAGHGGSNV
ncbi:hypothetical protein [Dickeya poaceiphila]|uniref:Uncharacterized protein n=1 Tax=Dickeya poaceiphila TaxID=568768 RepID=A0A5B8IEN4_9GAMM|nr:hypothetical protein [Dickeya poaceiphila]QDX30977.1 hypothetical protein Dpoa569_0002931 [Dickeya poaceiphila]